MADCLGSLLRLLSIHRPALHVSLCPERLLRWPPGQELAGFQHLCSMQRGPAAALAVTPELGMQADSMCRKLMQPSALWCMLQRRKALPMLASSARVNKCYQQT